MKEETLTKRYFYKLATNFSSAALGALTLLFVPRALGPAQYGQFDFISNHFTQLIRSCLVSVPEGFFNWVSKKGKKEDLNGPFKVIIILFASVTSLIFLFLCIAITLDWHSTIWPEIPKHILFTGLFFGAVTTLFGILSYIADGLAETISLERVRMTKNILRALLLLILIYFSALTLMSFFWLHNALIFLASVFLLIFFVRKRYIDQNIFDNYDPIKKKDFILF